MTMLALYREPDRRDLRRWSLGALIIAALHIGAVVGLTYWYRLLPPPGTTVPTILVDLSPVSASPDQQVQDVAPGPTMQQADPPAQEPEKQQPVEEAIAPTPPQPDPVVAAPPETPQQKPVEEPVKPKPVHEPVKKRSEKPPAPKTTASPRAERQAPPQSAAAAGAAAAAASASYGSMVSAHLRRFMQYPSAARGETGTAMVTFTLSRSGQVLSSRLTRATGQPALDVEATALIRRAQPFPPFPSEMRESSKSFAIPYRFSPPR